jgi:hypothetical protein
MLRSGDGFSVGWPLCGGSGLYKLTVRLNGSSWEGGVVTEYVQAGWKQRSSCSQSDEVWLLRSHPGSMGSGEQMMRKNFQLPPFQNRGPCAPGLFLGLWFKCFGSKDRVAAVGNSE